MFNKKFQKKKSSVARFATNGRRVTGVVTELPRVVKVAGAMVLGLFIMMVSVWGGWKLFNRYYFQSKTLFVLHDLRQGVSITTGKTLTADLICEVLGLRKGVNLFSIQIEQKRREMLEQAPNIRDISIRRRLPDQLNIAIIEREPIARVGPNGRVIDEEGVVFIRYAGTGGLPLIKGSDEIVQLKPGDCLHGYALAAVRLVNNALRPGCRLRLLVVDITKEDYLFLTFSDHRQAKIAWQGMSIEGKDTEAVMQHQFDRLAMAMESKIGQPRLMWDATQPGRIFAMPVGIQ